MTDTPGQAPAGWYPDPSGAPRQRYFDGEIWTEHYHDDAAPATADTFGADTSGGYSDQRPIGHLTGAVALFGDAWAGMRTQLGLLAGITVGYGVAMVAIYAVFFAWVSSRVNRFDTFGDIGNSFGEFIVVYLVFLFVLGLVSSIYLLMTSRPLLLEHAGRPSSMSDALSKTKERIWGFYFTSIGLYIAIYIGLLIFAIILTLIAEPAILLALIPMVVAWVKLAFLPAAAVATRRGDSIVTASAEVSTGQFWAILGRMLLLSIPLITTGIIVGTLSAASDGSISGAAAVLSLVVWLVGGVLGSLFLSSGLTKMYLDTNAPATDL